MWPNATYRLCLGHTCAQCAPNFAYYIIPNMPVKCLICSAVCLLGLHYTHVAYRIWCRETKGRVTACTQVFVCKHSIYWGRSKSFLVLVARLIHFLEKSKTFWSFKATVHAQQSCLTARTDGDTVACWQGPKCIAIFVTRPSLQHDHRASVKLYLHVFKMLPFMKCIKFQTQNHSYVSHFLS